MPRRKLIRQAQFPYHVLSRSNNKDWFQLPLSQVWAIAVDSLVYASTRFEVNLHAFVLMSNHYHLLLTTPGSDIDSFMQAFNKHFSENLKVATNRVNRMFGGPYKWSIIETELYLYNVHKYIYQNPLRAGMVDKCENYPYSTLFYKYRSQQLPLTICTLIEDQSERFITWINAQFNNQEEEGIRRALKHSRFTVTRERDSKYLPCYRLPAEFL